MPYRTWSAISNALNRCSYIFSHDERIVAGLGKFRLRLVTPAIERIGFEFDPNEDHLVTMLRKLLLHFARKAGHEK